MQTAASLVPGVTETDRLVFKVQSRSRKRLHTVDIEAKNGLGVCSCEDNQINKNVDCHHLQLVRKYCTIRLVHAIKQSHKH